jgi:hypothetical protein
MALVVPNIAEPVLLNYMLKTTSFPDYVLKLYSNNYTPAQGTILTDFTEASFTGYTGVTFARSAWATATANPVTFKGEASANQISWTAGSGETLYGYYVESDTGDLLWAELFNTSKAIQSGDILNITLNFTLASEN